MKSFTLCSLICLGSLAVATLGQMNDSTTGVAGNLDDDDDDGGGGGGSSDVDDLEQRRIETVQKLTKKKLAASVAAETEAMEWLASLYNPHRWNPIRFSSAKKLSGTCRSSMKQYMTGLVSGALWAAQMLDASGRYSSMFFFGNDFWLGSKKLCSEIGTSTPFPVAFQLVKFSVTLDAEFTPTPRHLSLGICLPEACSTRDVQELLEATAIPPHSKYRLDILRVRTVPGPYSLLDDPKLHILAAVTMTLAILMVVGTIYEVILERKVQKCRLRRTNNNETGKTKEDKLSFEKEELTESENDLMAAMDPCKGMGKLGDMVLSFSVLSNGRKILDCGVAPKDSLTCVHGLRFLSLAWIILVHTYLQIFTIAENKTMRALAERNFLFQTVPNATFSVDSFFFMSGLLVAYLFFKSTDKSDGDKTLRVPRPMRPFTTELKIMSYKFFTFLGYRFIRLTPVYLFVLGCAELTMKWLKNNSVFEPVSNDNVNCAKYWWRNVFYINSLYPQSEMCMLWSWYLSNDTQFYVLGIVLLLISSRFFRVAVSSLLLLLLSSIITTALISLSYNHVVSVQQPFILFDELYDKPWTRLGPYIVGIVTGWLLHRTKCDIRFPRVVAIAGWVLSLSTFIFLVYGVRDSKFGVTGTAIYVSLGHTAWGVGLSWIVIACTSGYGGWINSLLSCHLFQPLSRLAYCAYLIHPVIMAGTSFQMDGSLHINTVITLILYLGNIVAAYLASFILAVALEAPIVRVLKVCLSPLMRRQANN